MKVRKVRDGQGTVLISWRDAQKVQRQGWIPSDALDKDWEVDERVLTKAAPYGLPFEKILPKIVIDPKELATSLRSLGIWTAADVLRNPKALSEAILSCAHMSSAKIQTAVRVYEQSTLYVKQ